MKRPQFLGAQAPKILKLFTLVAFILLSACSEDEPVTKPQPNQSPVIDRIILPASVEANTPLKLQVIARDPDKDKLIIIWEASEGVVDSEVWTPPNRAASVVVSVHVSDKNNPTVTSSKNVTVIKTPEPVEPPPPEPPEPTQPPTPVPEPKPDPIAQFQPGIQPGVGIAAIRVGDTLAEVEVIHGKSTRDQEFFLYRHLNMGFALKNNRVSLITFIAPDKLNLKTKGGNGIGSLKADVERELGRSEKVTEVAGEIVFWYFAKGINFSYDRNDRVDTISVFKPIR